MYAPGSKLSQTTTGVVWLMQISALPPVRAILTLGGAAGGLPRTGRMAARATNMRSSRRASGALQSRDLRLNILRLADEKKLAAVPRAAVPRPARGQGGRCLYALYHYNARVP